MQFYEKLDCLMKLTDLRVNHVQEPLGFQLKIVSFS